ncbi:MAG: hypothetical protein QOC72_1922 [Methylobacteriaceae bacterium]|jgi:hypothetical protein|nr:hypothetical protein [Methylobacteriaceae bacterium]
MSEELKDLLSHLRAVHFTIIGTMFALLVVASLAKDASLQRASDQLARVAGLNQVLSKEAVAAAVAAASQRLPQEGLSVHEERSKLLWRVDNVYHSIREAETPLPRPRLWIPSESMAASPPHGYPASIDLEPERRTFRAFQLAWQFFLNGKRAFVVSALHPERATFRNDSNFAIGAPNYSESIVRITDAPGNFVLGPQFLVDPSIVSLGPDRYAIDFVLAGGQTSDLHLRFGRHAIVPIEIRSTPIDPMSFFLKDAGGLAPEERAQFNRSFVEVFRELSSTALGLESLTIEEMRSYISRIIREKGPEVELFGAKIPQEALVYWSLPALLALQIYFAITLHHLLSRYGSSFAVADFTWVAFYDSIFAKLVTQISFTMAPIVALIIVLQGWQFIPAPWVRALLVLGLLASAIVLYFDLRGLRALGQRLRARTEDREHQRG